MNGDDLRDLQDKITDFKSQRPDTTENERETQDRMTGMRAGSEFMAYIFAGGFVGWVIGHYFGNMPLWLISMLFLGFGLGIFRAYKAMK